MNYGHVEITCERWWLLLPLKFLHLIKYPWAQRLAYYQVARKVTNFDKETGTITLEKAFPKNVKPGEYVVESNKYSNEKT